MRGATSSRCEWGRLQLEQSAWSTHAFVERVASDQAAHEHAATARHRDRAAMKRARARDSARAARQRYRWRSCALLLVLLVRCCWRRRAAWRARSNCSWSITAFWRSRAMRASRASSTIAAHRGTITDRNGEPLAVSTPVDSVWVNPQELARNIEQLPQLATALKHDQQELARRVTSNLDREFLYLARHMPARAGARASRRSDIPGVYLLARIPPLLPGGRSDRARARLHQRRRCRPGRARARLRSTGSPARTAPSASSRTATAAYVENVESIRAGAPGPRSGPEHRPAHPVPGLPRAQGGDPE